MKENVTVTWLGHACFKMEYKKWSLIIDPYADGSVPGLGPVRESAGAVYCSHGHGDHAAAGNVKIKIGRPPIDFALITANCPHDDQGGKLRGDNRIHVFSFGGKKIVHMGDAGCMPSPAALKLAKGCDLLLIPVGGYYTVDAAEAFAITEAVGPRAVVPMHYRSDAPAFGFDVLSTVEDFAARFSAGSVVRKAESSLTVSEDAPRGLVILTPALAGK